MNIVIGKVNCHIFVAEELNRPRVGPDMIDGCKSRKLLNLPDMPQKASLVIVTAPKRLIYVVQPINKNQQIHL